MLTDAKGIPLSIAVDGANRHDMKMSRETLENIKAKRPKPTEEKNQGLCLDKGYDYDEVRELVKEFGFTAHIIFVKEEKKQKTSKRKQGKRPDAGLLSGHIAG
ncbi:Transposase DDE domain protein [uncultured archaeon]|nr:Transposase DDE domain protein [uncultured archaeon]